MRCFPSRETCAAAKAASAFCQRCSLAVHWKSISVKTHSRVIRTNKLRWRQTLGGIVSLSCAPLSRSILADTHTTGGEKKQTIIWCKREISNCLNIFFKKESRMQWEEEVDKKPSDLWQNLERLHCWIIGAWTLLIQWIFSTKMPSFTPSYPRMVSLSVFSVRRPSGFVLLAHDDHNLSSEFLCKLTGLIQ